MEETAKAAQLKLQKRIKEQYDESRKENKGIRKENCPQIVIFGKKGHAEVLGLEGQTEGNAIVIENFDEVTRLDFSRDIYLYSQTTKSLDEFHRIIDYIQSHIDSEAVFRSFDTICRSVANRMPNISQFATRHDLILFVCGRKSSNGKVLFNECLRVNPNSHLIEGPDEIQPGWLKDVSTIGICGATSTPTWLMEQCRNAIIENEKNLINFFALLLCTHNFCSASTVAKAFSDVTIYICTGKGGLCFYTKKRGVCLCAHHR